MNNEKYSLYLNEVRKNLAASATLLPSLYLDAILSIPLDP